MKWSINREIYLKKKIGIILDKDTEYNLENYAYIKKESIWWEIFTFIWLIIIPILPSFIDNNNILSLLIIWTVVISYNIWKRDSNIPKDYENHWRSRRQWFNEKIEIYCKKTKELDNEMLNNIRE